MFKSRFWTEARAACRTWFLTSWFAHSIWVHDELAGECGLRRLQQSDWFTAMCGLLPPPVTGNVPWCPGWDGEGCFGVWRCRWRWRSPLALSSSLSLASLPLSFKPLNLVSPFFLSFFFVEILILLSSILSHPHTSLLCLLSSLQAFFPFFSSHLTSLIIWLAANKSSYLRSVPEEIRVSFIIPY